MGTKVKGKLKQQVFGSKEKQRRNGVHDMEVDSSQQGVTREVLMASKVKSYLEKTDNQELC